MTSNFEIVSTHDSSSDLVFTGLRQAPLAFGLAECLHKKVIIPQIKDFADTETCVKIVDDNQIKNKILFVVQQFFFPSKKKSCVNAINNQVFKFLLLGDYLKKAGAKEIVGILPYLPYSRQAKTIGGKYAGAAFLLGTFFKTAGLERIICFDLHEALIKAEFSVKLDNIKLVEFWATVLKRTYNDDISRISLVSPDMGRVGMVAAIAKLLGVNFAYVEKKRTVTNYPIALELVGDIKEHVVIVDDIIDTARTAINACRLVLKKGAKKIIGCFTHAVLTGDAVKRLENSSFEKIFLTDTIPSSEKLVNKSKFCVLSIKDLLCGFVKNIN